MRYWIGVASRDHVMRGVAGGFCQLDHGKAAPVRRLSEGDGIVFYSPRTVMDGGVPVQAFTALGTVEAGEAYPFDMGGGFVRFRRNVKWAKTEDVSIRSLIDKLSFTRGNKNWGAMLRRGFFEIDRGDFDIIANAMTAPKEG